LTYQYFNLRSVGLLFRNGSYEKWLAAGRTIHVHPPDQQSIKTDRDGVIVLRKEKGFWVAEE